MARIKRNLKPRQSDSEDECVAGRAEDDDMATVKSSWQTPTEDEYFGTALYPTTDDADDSVLAPRTLSTGASKVPVGSPPVVKKSKSKGKSKGKKGKAEASSPPAATKRVLVSLDEPRKLTKAAREILEEYHGDNFGRTRDDLITGHVAKCRQKFGTSGVFHGNETERLVIGIPCPLAFEFLIANDAFVLGVIYHLVGKHKSKKCLGEGTLVLMADGRQLSVEQVQVGDRLAGSSGVRTVLSVSEGVGPLYLITPGRGEPWVCNDAHILTVVKAGTTKVIDISVQDWLASTPTFRRRHFLFTQRVDRFNGGSPPSSLPVDPYFLGVWFGGGSKTLFGAVDGSVALRQVRVTKQDPEIRALCAQTAECWGLRVRVDPKDSYCLVSDEPGGFQAARVNRLLTTLRDLVGPRITIPSTYLTADREARLRFLAGFLDADGCLISDTAFLITQKREDWARAIYWLARSLGFGATFRTQRGGYKRADGTMFEGTYHVVQVSGDVSVIPTRIPRKQAPSTNGPRDVTRTAFEVSPLDEGRYYGFTLDGDGRFLLGDCTVTHNSGLLAEFFRWAFLAGGFGALKECESKFSPSWFRSIMRGVDPKTGKEIDYFAKLPVDFCQSIEQWQKRLTYDMRSSESYCRAMDGTKDRPGPGRTMPVIFGIDSIMGKLAEHSQATIVKDGSAGRGYPVEALQISRYLSTMPTWLDRWPFAVVLVNHLKLSQNPDTGREERNMSGGKRTLFQESFELEMSRGSSINCVEFEGSYIDISCVENSLAPDRRRLRTRVIWWEEPDENGRFAQKTKWDWDWALVNLLHTIMKGDDKGNHYVRYRHHLKEAAFHMEFIGAPTALYSTAWSKTVGVSEKDPLTWAEMGALIRETPAVVELLRNALRIYRRPWLEGDYLKQLNQLAEAIT